MNRNVLQLISSKSSFLRRIAASSLLPSTQPKSSTTSPMLLLFPQQCRRGLAFITGHKVTKRKNKKKQAAKNKKQQRIHDRKQQQRFGAGNAKRNKQPFYDTPTPPDYPLGPNYIPKNDDDNDKTTDSTTKVVVPPLLLATTGSPFVYIAKAAVVQQQQEEQEYLKQLFIVNKEQQQQQQKQYNFEEIVDVTKIQQQQPAVAVLGRSNVGKSSLLNALMNNQNLAITSKQPGRTQKPYYYYGTSISNTNNKKKKNILLVDLPGYGYAVGPDKVIDSWQKGTQEFLLSSNNINIKQVLLLQDSRLGKPQSIDQDVINWFEDVAQIPYTIVLTKADGSNIPTVIKHANLCSMQYQQFLSESNNNDNDNDDISAIVSMSPIIHITSAKKRYGILELLQTIENEINDYNHDDDYDYDDE